MNCPNCGRMMSVLAQEQETCLHCQAHVPFPPAAEDRTTLALESIAESLRNLPSKRELMAMLAMYVDAFPDTDIMIAKDYMENYVSIADAIIAACKEGEPMKGDAT